MSVDPSESDTTSPITQAERDSATFTIKLQQPFTSFDWISQIGGSNNCSITFVGDSCDFSFSNITANPYLVPFYFDIDQAWINANYTTVNNNPTVSIGSVVQVPFNLDFNLKLESTSPNVIIPTNKNTYNFIGLVQAKRTA
jgi:hypothetical protein